MACMSDVVVCIHGVEGKRAGLETYVLENRFVNLLTLLFQVINAFDLHGGRTKLRIERMSIAMRTTIAGVSVPEPV